jgi:mRNA interferase RelE/StbE
VGYEVIFAATARRNLERIPPRIVAAIIVFVFGDLAMTPKRVGKPLQRDLEGSYSARRGPYRIIYDIDDVANRIEILRVDHRPDVYRGS